MTTGRFEGERAGISRLVASRAMHPTSLHPMLEAVAVSQADLYARIAVRHTGRFAYEITCMVG